LTGNAGNSRKVGREALNDPLTLEASTAGHRVAKRALEIRIEPLHCLLFRDGRALRLGLSSGQVEHAGQNFGSQIIVNLRCCIGCACPWLCGNCGNILRAWLKTSRITETVACWSAF